MIIRLSSCEKFDNPIIGGEKGASNKNSGKLSAINREYKSLIRQELRALGENIK